MSAQLRQGQQVFVPVGLEDPPVARPAGCRWRHGSEAQHARRGGPEQCSCSDRQVDAQRFEPPTPLLHAAARTHTHTHTQVGATAACERCEVKAFWVMTAVEPRCRTQPMVAAGARATLTPPSSTSASQATEVPTTRAVSAAPLAGAHHDSWYAHVEGFINEPLFLL